MPNRVCVCVCVLTRWAACPRAEPQIPPRSLAGCSQAHPCSALCIRCRRPSTQSPGLLQWPTDREAQRGHTE